MKKSDLLSWYDQPLLQDREKVVCFDSTAMPLFEFSPEYCEAIKKCILMAYNDGKRVFVSQCFRGFDTMAAVIVSQLKNDYRDLKLVLLGKPSVHFVQKMETKTNMKMQADVKCVVDVYTYERRVINRKALVEHSSGIICIYKGKYSLQRNIPAMYCEALRRNLKIYNGYNFLHKEYVKTKLEQVQKSYFNALELIDSNIDSVFSEVASILSADHTWQALSEERHRMFSQIQSAPEIKNYTSLVEKCFNYLNQADLCSIEEDKNES